MIEETPYTIPQSYLMQAVKNLPTIDFKETLNEPSGEFFYDMWNIKPKYKNTIWEQILSTLPYEIGEARLIKLASGNCYYSHSDIDDRFHMNITGEKSFLVDIDSQKMYPTTRDGKWYSMDASPKHSAVNFGAEDRVQLVVRKLLTRNDIHDGVRVSISGMSNDTKQMSRYIFDDILSKWLNLKCKSCDITDVIASPISFEFTLSRDSLEEFEEIIFGSGLTVKLTPIPIHMP